MGQGIISGIWLYAEDKPVVVHATFEALPPLLTALDIGSVRFLKVRTLFITRLCRFLTLSCNTVPYTTIGAFAYTSTFAPCGQRSADFCTSGLEDTSSCLHTQNTILERNNLDAVARCWVGILDEERKGHDSAPVTILASTFSNVTPYLSITRG